MNIHGLPTESGMRKKMPAIEDLIEGDVATFQEVFHVRARHELHDVEGHPYVFMPNMHVKLFGSGLATVSEHPIVKTKFMPYGRAANWDFFVSKGVQLTQIQHPQLGVVDIYNTHLQASYRNSKQHARVRMRQLAQLVRFIQKHSMPGHTIILCGDFNMHPESPEYAYLTRALPGAVDILSQLHPPSGPVTFVGDPASHWYSGGGTPQAQRLDYVFVIPAEGLRLKLEDCTAQASMYPEGQALSDHLPLEIKMVFERK